MPGVLRNGLLFGGSYLVACFFAALFALLVGATESFLITGEPVFCVGFFLALVVQLLLNCYLFGAADSCVLPQRLPSCRCLGHYSAFASRQ